MLLIFYCKQSGAQQLNKTADLKKILILQSHFMSTTDEVFMICGSNFERSSILDNSTAGNDSYDYLTLSPF